MSDADGDDAAEKVEVLLSIDIPDVLHLAALEWERLVEIVRNRGIDVLLLLCQDLFALHRTVSSISVEGLRSA